MLKIFLFLLFIPSICISQNDSTVIKGIYDEVLSNSPVYENLKGLCKDVGHRLSGSIGAAAAVDYTRQLMLEYDFDTVFLQPIMVPHWVRGRKEIVRVVDSRVGNVELSSLALGNSVGTGPNGIRAEVIEVNGMAQVEEFGEVLKNKIVFYNGPMDPTRVGTFNAYGNAVIQRAYGASEAAKFGAKAVIVRSMTQGKDDVPHTGSLVYKPNLPRIPAVSISAFDSEVLSRLLKQQKVEVYLETNCRILDKTLSYNVVGQINGSEIPDEYIAVGGHLDSWDVGEGAHDDGAGCMQAIEALRLFKALGIKPKRTLRAVMWMNEENGLVGGREYARLAEEKNERHVAAIESDRGGFLPIGFTSSGDSLKQEKFKSWKSLFLPYGLYNFEKAGGGADIGPLVHQGTFLIGLLPDGQRYFRFHHTAADVFEQVDRRELELGAASIAGMIYLVDRYGLD